MQRISRLRLHLSTAISRLFGPHFPAPTANDFNDLKESLKGSPYHTSILLNAVYFYDL